MRCREPEPFAAHVVNVGEDVGDSASFDARQLGTPGLRVQMIEEKLVHLIVDEE